MLTGLLAVLLVGHVAGSIETESRRDYPRYDRGYYAGYGAYGRCAYRGYADCGYYRRYGHGGYEYGYDGYDYRGYEYGGYGD
jgi:hypothetical protein